MGDKTGIEWTDATWNPIRGCSRVSEGCRNCYAETVAARFSGPGQPYEGLAQRVTRPDGTSEARWTGKVAVVEEAMTQPLRWRQPRRIFVNSMSDLFHESVLDEVIDRVFAVMALAPQHVFQVLTKRPERMREYCGDPETPFRVAKAISSIGGKSTDVEEFQPIEGFPGYVVSSHGHVYSDRRGKRRRLRPDAGEQGHQRVPLFRDGGPRRGERLLVHRLVLQAFVGPAPGEDAQGRHLDGDPSNNVIGNLEWGGQSANWADSKRHGSFRRYAKLSPEDVAVIRRRAAAGEAAYSIAKDYPVSDTQVRNIVSGQQWSVEPPITWPLGNVWKGVSVEDQATADARIPPLLDTPAAVRFISAEPLLGPVDLTRVAPKDNRHLDVLAGVECWIDGTYSDEFTQHIDWVIVGGESGAGARPMHPDWARSIRDQCKTAGVPFFFKQWGEWAPRHQWLRGVSGARMTAIRSDGTPCDDYADEFERDGQRFERVGKARAGRLLDGLEHNDMPSVGTGEAGR